LICEEAFIIHNTMYRLLTSPLTSFGGHYPLEGFCGIAAGYIAKRETWNLNETGECHYYYGVAAVQHCDTGNSTQFKCPSVQPLQLHPNYQNSSVLSYFFHKQYDTVLIKCSHIGMANHRWICVLKVPWLHCTTLSVDFNHHIQGTSWNLLKWKRTTPDSTTKIFFYFHNKRAGAASP